MGAWGSGLYSGDFAPDLRSAIAALARLPFAGEKILDILRASEAVSQDNTDPDHTTFWFVVADQLQKRGIPCSEATARALALIESGADSAMMRSLGMTPSDLRKREARIAELRARLIAGPLKKRGSTLQKPQRFVMDVGSVYLYLTSQGEPINPYLRDKHLDRNWHHDGWSAMVIIERGLAYGYLAWYAPLVVFDAFAKKPALETVLAHARWLVRAPGTCSPLHFRRMELETIGRVNLDREACMRLSPSSTAGCSAASADISIANQMSVSTSNSRFSRIHEELAKRVPRGRDLCDIMLAT